MSGQQTAASDPYFPANGDSRYRVHRYELALEYRPGPNRLAGTARLSAIAGRAPLTEFHLNLAEFKIGRVLVNGRAPHYSHRGGRLRVRPAKALSAGAAFTVEVHWAGNPKPVRSPWGGLGWEELTDGALVASQPTGAPSWFPCNDHPADKASYRITVTTESPYTVLATGVLTGRRRSAGTRTWVYERPEPTASYLVSVQIGRYEEVRLAAGPVPQTAAVPARLRRNADRDLGRHGQIMTTLQRYFGPYPFGNYQLVVTDDELDDPIEAQGMSIFGANHLDGRRTHERLVVHELAHQWCGNSLTIADWRHIWLNEGFATYAEWLWSEASGGRSAAAHARQWHAQLATAPADLVLADPGLAKMFDQRVYKRGGLTLHALRIRIGDERFFGLLREWTARHRYGSVSTDQFVVLAERFAGQELTELFAEWLYRTALPALPR